MQSCTTLTYQYACSCCHSKRTKKNSLWQLALPQSRNLWSKLKQMISALFINKRKKNNKCRFPKANLTSLHLKSNESDSYSKYKLNQVTHQHTADPLAGKNAEYCACTFISQKIEDFRVYACVYLICLPTTDCTPSVPKYKSQPSLIQRPRPPNLYHPNK